MLVRKMKYLLLILYPIFDLTHSKVPNSDVDSRKGLFVTLLGWGKTNDIDGGIQPTPRLKYKNLAVLSQQCCNDSWISDTPDFGKCGTKSYTNRIDMIPNLFQSTVCCAKNYASNKNRYVKINR